MGSALEAVLNLKAQEKAQQQQASDNITQAVQMLQQAKQQSIQNQMAALQYKSGLAEKGLKQNSDGSYQYDPSVMNPLQQVLTGTKLQADAKTAGNKKVYDMASNVLNNLLPGNNDSANIQSSSPIPAGTPLAQVLAPTATQTPATTSAVMTPTSQTSQTDPITGLTTGTTTMTNIPAKLAETKATDVAKEQAQAEIGSSRDTAQFQMVAQGLKNLNEIHKKLSDQNLAGNSLANLISTHYQNIPNQDLQNKIVSPENQKLIGKFISARNEALVKIQPILSQQFGQAGTSRIMQSLVELSKGEFGDLGTPHAQFEGQAEGTLGSFYRFKIASDKYLDGLKKAGQSLPENTVDGQNQVIQGIASNLGDLNPSQQKQLDSIVNSTLGKSNQSLPSGITEADVQHTLKLHPEFTREQLLKKLGK